MSRLEMVQLQLAVSPIHYIRSSTLLRGSVARFARSVSLSSCIFELDLWQVSLYPCMFVALPLWSLLPSTVHDLQTFECATDPNQLTDNDQRKPDIFYDTVTWNISTHPRQNRHFRYGHGNDVRYEIAMCRRRPISASVNTNSHWKMTPCIVQLLQISLCVCSFKIIGQSIKLKRPEIWWCII